jgi:ornithine--oxo-acid transaminase
LYDEQGERYLDLLSGWGVFAVGRNHPTVREALSAVLDSELPNLVQMGVSALSGVLAERLLKFVPHLDKVFFSNSDTEAVESAIKFLPRLPVSKRARPASRMPTPCRPPQR